MQTLVHYRRLILLFIFCPIITFAQNSDTLNLEDMSLKELMDIPINIASSTAQKSKESAAIITVITENDIENLGARDLVDVLRLVSGIDFGSDIFGSDGIIMRGLWGAEGKVAVFIDDLEYNDLLFGSTPLANHFAPESIHRIEIIRGPGSALYGGTAQYGVIKIYTKNSQKNGFQVTQTNGMYKEGFARTSTAINGGYKKGDFEIGLNANLGRVATSAATLYDAYDSTNTINTNSTHRHESNMLNFLVRYKELRFKLSADDYLIKGRDGYGAILDTTSKTFFKNLSLQLDYKILLGDKVTIKPLVSYRFNNPWATVQPFSAYLNNSAERILGKLDFIFQPHKNITALLGGQIFNDRAATIPLNGVNSALNLLPPNRTESVSYFNRSLYTQIDFLNKIVNITAGARYDNHSLGFDNFVPRIGLMKSIENFNIKLLASQAFRTPFIRNMSNSTIIPEKSTIYELELGYHITKNLFIVANIFDITTQNSLYYQQIVNSSGNTLDGYFNGNSTGSRGIEFEVKAKQTWGSLTANYSHAGTYGKNQASVFAIDPSALINNSSGQTNFNQMLGAAQHKFTFNGNVKIYKTLRLNTSLIYISERFGTAHTLSNSAGADSLYQITKYDPITTINAYLLYKDIFIQGLDIGFGIANILDTKLVFITPYLSPHLPMPSTPREFYVRASYTFR